MKALCAILILFVLLPFAALAQQISYVSDCGFQVVGFHDSGDWSERYTQVVLGRRDIVMLLRITVDPGDVLVVAAEGQVTSERDTNTEIVSQLELYHNGQFWEISEENGENVDIDRHHHKLTSTGMIVVPDDVSFDTVVRVFWRWGAFDGTALPNWVWVDQDYGRMIATQYRPLC